MWYEKDLLAQIQELKDENKLLEAKYAQRDQRQREALIFLRGLYANEAVDECSEFEVLDMIDEAITSHPADNDASMFVERIQTDLLNEMYKWALKNQSLSQVNLVQDIANEKDIKITEDD